MRFNKKNKRGLYLLFLLLLITTSISFITFDSKNYKIDETSVLLSVPEDPYEENDIPQNATDIRFNEANWLSNHLGNGSQWDDDWYMIDLDLGEERLKVELIFNHSAGNIDLEVYNSTYDFIIGNYSMDDNEILELDIFPSGVNYLRIFGDNAQNAYDLWWEDLLPTDDRFEENDDFGGAQPVALNYHSNLKVVYGDEDWFTLYLNAGDSINVSIFFNHMDGNLSLELFDPFNTYRTGSYSMDNDEYIFAYTADVSGDWRIRVFHATSTSEVVYDMDIWVFVDDDGMEDNDDFGSAWYVNPNYYPNLKIVYSDEDWYRTFVNSGDTINVSIYFNHIVGNLELELYDPSNIYRTGSYSMDNDEYIFSFTADVSGDWRIRVYHIDANSTVNYDMDIWVYGIDDGMEENDDFGSAVWVDPDYYSNLKIVNGDEDWFRIYLDYDDIIDLSIYFNDMDGNLELELFDPSYSYQFGSHSIDNDEFISYISDLPPGEWRIRVYHADVNSTVNYDMDIRVDDGMEENDDFGSAWYVNPNYYPNLKIVYSDEDWYRIYLNQDDVINISLYFNVIDGNLELELYDPSNSYRTGSHSSNNDESISFTADWSGEWRIRVYHADATSNVFYDMNIWLYGGDDWMEENDDFWNAWYVDPNKYYGLMILHGDEDWFSTHLNVDDNINISIYFNHYEGNLTLELYDPFNTYQAGSYSLDDDEFIFFTVNMSGDWRIRVYHANANSEVSYDMDIWVYRGDDQMEENDDYWSARWVDPEYYPDLMIIEYDDDWFRTYLNIDDRIDISIYFDNYKGDLQLELYDPTDPYYPRDGSHTTRDDEHISFTADVTGDWRFRIYHEFGDSNVRYHLEVRINGEIGGDDPYEMNNDFNEAYDLHDDERIWLSNKFGLAVQGDPDWYMIDVTPGFQHLIVNLEFNRSLGDINVDIYRLVGMHGIEWVTANYSLTGKNWYDINISHIDWGIYFIQVHGDSSGVEYDLWWDDVRTDNRTDDYYEENDDPLTAYDLSFHQYEELIWINELAIQKDNDWYKIQVGSGFEHLFILVIYDYQEGAIGIEVYDWVNTKVTSNFTMEDNEIISYTLPSNGSYYIRIFGDRSGNTYSLFWYSMEPSVEEMIPGYDIFILLGAIFGVVVVVTLKWKRSKKHL